MGSRNHLLLVILSLLSVTLTMTAESSTANPIFKPTELVVPVLKDGGNTSSLHITSIRKRTPFQSVPLLVDLNSKFLWVTCDQNYSSSTYQAPICHSTVCSRAGTHYCHKCPVAARPGCHNNTCAVLISNPITHSNAMGEIAIDALSVPSSSTQSNPGPPATVPRFIFACGPSSLLKQGPIPTNVQGIAGLGHSPVALPTQLASHFGFQPKFALCLSSTPGSNGVIFFGGGPYKLGPSRMDVSNLGGVYTPLTIGSHGEYLIQVKSIRVDKEPIPLNGSLLSRQGTIETMISTTASYTLLEHSIFNAVTQLFSKKLAALKVSQVKSVPPFGVCVDANTLTRLEAQGPAAVPAIDFVFQNRNVTWSILGGNSMIVARPGVSCLAFVDAGLKPRASIVIGAHQFEDNLLQFDLERSRLGLSSALKNFHVTCSFNHTTTTTTTTNVNP